jgi:phosphate uptake regulator
MDDEVDRFGFYIIRQLKAAIEDPIILKEIGLPSRRYCLGYRLITKAVERTADHAVKIAENILMLRQPIDIKLCETINSMSVLAASVFNETVETIFKEDFRQANEIVQKAKQAELMRNDLMESILEREIEGASNLSLIIESVTRSAEYASDIAEIVLNLNIEQNLA